MAYAIDDITLIQDFDAENVRQMVDLLFPIVTGNSLNNRKDSYNLKLNIYTGGSNLNVLIYVSHQDDPILVDVVNTSQLEKITLDISNIAGITRYWQVRLVGLCADFKLTEYSIDYDNRPEPQTFQMVPWVDGGPNKKRMRVWPVTMDTLDEEATIIPYVDGVAFPPLICQSNYPKTFLYQFVSDVFGIDYAISIHGCEEFELYKIHEPIGVQTLPVAKRYDQVGPQEFFRYGKIIAFAVRVIAFGGTTIPYNIIFEDNSKETGDITVVDGKEDTHLVYVNKTRGGQIMRFELGPTGFDFHRFYIHFKVNKSGADTDAIWVPIE